MLGRRHLLCKGFVVGRCRVAQGGVTPLADVPDLDEREDRQGCGGPYWPDRAAEQFDLERRAAQRAPPLGHRVVEAVPDRPHRGEEAVLLQVLAQGQGGVLTAVIGVMGQPGMGLTAAVERLRLPSGDGPRRGSG